MNQSNATDLDADNKEQHAKDQLNILMSQIELSDDDTLNHELSPAKQVS